MSSYFRTWAAYRKGFSLALAINTFAESLPQHEKYKLADQMSRSSRSVCSSLGESFGKRRYPKHFVSKITDAASENYETQVWLDFALAKKYLDQQLYDKLLSQSEEVGRILSWMEANPKHFEPKPR